MQDYNKITLVGRLTSDSKLGTFKRDGKDVAKLSFSIAVNRYNDGVDYFPVAVWGNHGKGLSFLKKGMRVLLDGRMQLDRVENIVEDKSQTYIFPSVQVDNVQCLDSKGKSQEEGK